MIRSYRKDGWKLVYGNRRLVKNSLSFRLINSLYPDLRKSRIDLMKELGQNVDYAMSRLKHKEIVKQDYDFYYLTQFGRWLAISGHLGLSFLELCALACACCIQGRFDKLSSTPGFYMLPTLEETFHSFYSKNRLRGVFSYIKSKGFAYRYSKQTLRIYSKKHEELMQKYGIEFSSLEHWCDEVEKNSSHVLYPVLQSLNKHSIM